MTPADSSTGKRSAGPVASTGEAGKRRRTEPAARPAGARAVATRAAQAPLPGGPAPAISVDAAPLRVHPAEARQLAQCYCDLLDLHREVVDGGDLEGAYRLLTRQVLPLAALLGIRECLVVAPEVELTY